MCISLDYVKNIRKPVCLPNMLITADDSRRRSLWTLFCWNGKTLCHCLTKLTYCYFRKTHIIKLVFVCRSDVSKSVN